MTGDAVYSASDVARITGGRIIGAPGEKHLVRFLLIDSRKLLSPSNTLFFALHSRQNDGHRYIEELLQKGVRVFVVKTVAADWPNKYSEASFILVGDPLVALQKLAAAHRARFTYPVLSLTGSNGKTVIKEWLYQSLYEKQTVVKNPKSYNSQIGVPLSVWLMTDRHELGIFEAGISQRGEMKTLAQILQPETGIFTNIGPAHDEGFDSRKEKIHEKLQLFNHSQTLIYCRDHQDVHDEICHWQKDHQDISVFSWGWDPNADIQIIQQEKGEDKTLISVMHQGQKMVLSIPFCDNASVENALHVSAYMKHAGYDDGYICQKLSALQPVAMRLEMKEGVNNCTIINDSYNSDIYSLAIALDFMSKQLRHMEKTLILSDILQAGVPDKTLYSEVASLVASKKVGRLIGIGPNISLQAGRFTIPANFFRNTGDFIAHADLNYFRNEAILLKGSRPFGFERISNLLQQKDHQTILEIDLDALIHNLSVYRSLLAPGVKIMGMVKAFSYGSGSLEVSRMLQYHNADYLAVAYADEGKALRQGGVHIPIVVMNPEIRSLDTLLYHRLEPEIYGFPLLQRYIDTLEKLPEKSGESTYPIHIKLDTGMHRLGFAPDDVHDLISIFRNKPYLRVASVFSHLAASEDTSHDVFTKKQIAQFDQSCRALEKALNYPFLRHICNSAGISRFPEAHFDMVRLGIGLYGISGDPGVQSLLHHVSNFRSVVSQVKTLSQGDTVGYNRAGMVSDHMEIAIVPVGYADGLNRRLGNGCGKLLVKGHRAPIVGNISMDMCAIDVTGLNVKEGDEVIVFGEGMPVLEMARDLDTIPYEVFTSISQRVKRIYYQE